MITKEQLAASMIRQCDVCVHLFGKLTPDAYAYRPSPTQRTTLDLLRYLSICGIASLRCMAEQNWNLFGDFAARSREMPAADFPAAMERQKTEIAAFFDSIDEHTLETQAAPLPTGGTAPLGVAILNGPFKWIAAYKLQLFLYTKTTSASDIGTANAWAGVDRKV